MPGQEREPVFLLIHSPFVGPTTWSPVARELERRGRKAVVPSLLGVADAEGPQWHRAEEAVRAAVGADRVVLVGHSGAGLLLPTIVDALIDDLAALIFVDSFLPPASGDRRGRARASRPHRTSSTTAAAPHQWPARAAGQRTPARASRSARFTLAPRTDRRYAAFSSASPRRGAVHVQVRLGTGLATAAGTSRLQVELPGNATVETLVRRLRELEPAIAPGLDAALPLVRGTHAGRGERLAEGDEVALLMPVAGGCAGPTRPQRRQPWP